ncbi:serine--tRNA ligase [Synechococcus sp. CS-602]|uniref:serine--tRNA ligase n=1 Tax=Synechococcaceae TaxID=1890426 RepID=UPI0008FF446B|nr:MULTISPECIES: serine--tRNA ligase [Synechococcaceae]MCT4365400.1 serine--tRNA ligase [Candidatus Regnicoccus frigidus MAG-AL1]APD49284.1 serine--tRNA ligase [Synechococcus sp. SynAce01]MCT0202464.1 serine--tRNA ligase [Synechococcus sp. CS-603]MCT0204270.1 serine--tRNA ligase [Synechococcus sp. CS-602]MCT0247111.1 serine--tRNA ligase [Synechococcus sp. CS-601]
MLDLRLVRDTPELIVEQLGRRGLKLDLTALQMIARQERDLEQQRSSLQAEGNLVGRQVGELIRSGEAPHSPEVQALRDQGNRLKQQVGVLEEEEKSLETRLRDQLLAFPNLPSPHCPEGRSEADNIEVRRWGTPRQGEGLQEHWQIAERLGLIDSERSVRIAQSRFVTLLGQGARLERALISLMLDLHGRRGYREVMPPILVNSASLMGSGQLPKFAEESFRCADDDLWLTPTAEVPITSFHRDELIAAEQLPLKYAAYTPCFRREAGTYGRDTRGLIRLHQFNKVELYWFCSPEASEAAHAQLTGDAEAVLQALDLPYRVLELCTGDLGFSAARTFDLEVWLPGAGAYREISSCSNCGDFQARRSAIRQKDGKKTRLLHTLNGSGLAVGRTMAALLETGQQADGSVLLPQALVPYMGCDRLVAET